MGTTIMQLEREKHDIQSELEQLKTSEPSRILFTLKQEEEEQGKKEETVPVEIVEQIMKDKQELEARYNDLFNLYSILLAHNRTLSENFESLAREKEVGEHEKSVKDINKEPPAPPAIDSSRKVTDTSLKEEHNQGVKLDEISERSEKSGEYNVLESFFSIEDDKVLSMSRRSYTHQSPQRDSSLMKTKYPSEIVLEDIRDSVNP